jgi:Spy/CpxP family protein refolding chaperone
MAKTWQVILATVAIFVAGLVTGGATALGIVAWVAHHRAMNGGLAGPFGQRPGVAGSPVQQFTPQLIRSFVNQLDLTTAQRARIMPIVRRTAGQLIRNRREIQLTSALAIERMQDEIADILTPGQRTIFENLIRQQRARLQQFKQGVQAPAPEEAQPPQASAQK